MIQKRYKFSLLLVTILTILSYQYIDREIATYFHTLHNETMTEVFKFFTTFGNSAWYFIPSTLLFVFFKKIKKHNHNALIASYIFMTNLIAGLLVWVFKIPFGRVRPKLFFEQNLYGFKWFKIQSDFVSFPSGHTITIISTVVALSLLLPKWKYLFLPFGILVALSRVVLNQHYLSDVLFASFLGTMVALFLHQYYFKNKEF